jgi:hypothetical protein
MKPLISTLAIALAFSFAAVTPAETKLTNLAKCKVYNAKIKMNYAKCLESGNLLVAKGKAPNTAKCEDKRTKSLEKAKSGGYNNAAHGEDSSVSGGNSRTASDSCDWVAGSLLEDWQVAE